MSHGAGFTVLPKRIQRIYDRLGVRLLQVIERFGECRTQRYVLEAFDQLA